MKQPSRDTDPRRGLFIQVVLLEFIVGQFEQMRNNGEEPECDAALAYLIKCVEDDCTDAFFTRKQNNKSIMWTLLDVDSQGIKIV